MQRLLFVSVLLCAAIWALGCSSGNKNKNATVTSVATPGVALSPQAATPERATPSFRALAGSPTPAVAAATPSVVGTPSTSPVPMAASPTLSASPTQAATAAATATATAARSNAAAEASSRASSATATATAASSASGGPADPRALVDAIKLDDSNLPSGFSLGSLFAYQPNEQAIIGYADPQSVLDLLNSTGRQDGYVEQINGPGSSSFGVSIQVWKDAAGAKAFFDQHPLPDSSVSYQQVQLDQPIGEQYQALKIAVGAGSRYALSWRVGRVVLGIGGDAGPDGKPSQSMLQLVDLLTKRAQAAQQ